MLMTFGILMLLTGSLLLAISLLRLPFIKNRGCWRTSITIKMLGVSFLLIVFSIILIHSGQGQGGINGIAFGFIMFMTGMIVVGLGTWIGFWGPLSLRNTNKGLQFIMIGLVLLIISIFTMSITKIDIPDSNNITHCRGDTDLGYMFSRSMGPIKFGTFALILFIFTNGIALRAGLKVGRLIGVNLVLLALLVLVYAIGPNLFCYW